MRWSQPTLDNLTTLIPTVNEAKGAMLSSVFNALWEQQYQALDVFLLLKDQQHTESLLDSQHNVTFSFNIPYLNKRGQRQKKKVY